ncbi:SPOR domain-containing protein [Cohnella nanjingensis]|uniref:SPOR domain-containing protein n=1 Tax=Cohnella nanjingensis TaxID=1387779 RepID=A0A7X0RXE0_9BACL|nr:SPOR domain-containing protein [Cohnella nanjingensis]MBB6674236.1 SPOR domain-containing protein [Cohnella nanjingensis]
MQQKTKMTFRFDGAKPRETTQQRPSVQEKVQDAWGGFPHPAQPHGQETQTQTETRMDGREEPRKAEAMDAWHSPYQDDIHALEEIIRRSDPYPQAQAEQPAGGASASRQSEDRSPQTPLADANSNRDSRMPSAHAEMAGARAQLTQQAPNAAPIRRGMAAMHRAPAVRAESQAPARRSGLGRGEPAPAARPNERASNAQPDVYRSALAPDRRSTHSQAPGSDPGLDLRGATAPDRRGGFGKPSAPEKDRRSGASETFEAPPLASSNLPPELYRPQPGGSAPQGRKSVTGFSAPASLRGQTHANRDGLSVYPESTFADLPEEDGYRPEIDPAVDEPANHGWMSSAYLRRREGPSWLRIFVSVAGAIVTGAIFGYLALSLFTGEPLFPGKSSGADTPVNAGVQPPADAPQTAGEASPASASTASAGAKDADPASGAEPAQGTVSAVAPASAYYLLQYGVFGTQASMNDAVKELAGKGLPAASDTTDGFRVYAGIAATREEAAALAKTMAGTEVYVKTLENQPLDLADNAQAARWATYLKTGDALTARLADLASNALLQEKAQALPAEEVQAMELTYAAWQKAAQDLQAWAGASKTEAESHAALLAAAAKELRDHAGSPTQASLRKVQTGALQAALAANRIRLDLQLGSGR